MPVKFKVVKPEKIIIGGVERRKLPTISLES